MPSISQLQSEWNAANGTFPQAGTTGNANVDALARVVASEGYSGPKQVGWAAAAVGIAWTEVNRAKYDGRSLFSSIAPSGTYGPQGEGGREVASSKSPNTWHLRVAQAVMNGAIENPVGAAHHYFDPYVQDGGVQAGKSLKPADWIITNWHDNYKWAWIGQVNTLDPYALMFFRPEANASTRNTQKTKALAAIYDGRRRVVIADGRRRLNAIAYAGGSAMLTVAIVLGITWIATQ